MTIKLPPLPEPAWPRDFFGSVPPGAYTADQLRAAQREAALMALDEAASYCDRRELNHIPNFELGLAAKQFRKMAQALRTELEAS